VVKSNLPAPPTSRLHLPLDARGAGGVNGAGRSAIPPLDSLAA
jgi:hypothetical protein